MIGGFIISFAISTAALIAGWAIWYSEKDGKHRNPGEF